jgi:hypothetical protein
LREPKNPTTQNQKKCYQIEEYEQPSGDGGGGSRTELFGGSHLPRERSAGEPSNAGPQKVNDTITTVDIQKIPRNPEGALRVAQTMNHQKSRGEGGEKARKKSGQPKNPENRKT